MPRVKQVRAKEGGVTRQIANRNMKVAAVLDSAGQVEVAFQVVADHDFGSEALPVEDGVQGVGVGHVDGHEGQVGQLRDAGGQLAGGGGGLHGHQCWAAFFLENKYRYQ